VSVSTLVGFVLVVVGVVVLVVGLVVVAEVVVVTFVVDVVGVGVDSGLCMSSTTPKMISPISTTMSRPIPVSPRGLRQPGMGSGSGSAPLLP
jgi:hypothetical protein